MDDDQPRSVIDTLAKVTGFSRGSMDQMLKEIKANQALLDACKGHDFSRPHRQQGPFVRDWACSKCGGVVDAAAKRWYERGLQDGLRRG